MIGGIAAGMLAAKKRRSTPGWVLLALLLTPLAILILLALPSLPDPGAEVRARSAASTVKNCPQCGTSNDARAATCRICGYALQDDAAVNNP